MLFLIKYGIGFYSTIYEVLAACGKRLDNVESSELCRNMGIGKQRLGRFGLMLSTWGVFQKGTGICDVKIEKPLVV